MSIEPQLSLIPQEDYLVTMLQQGSSSYVSIKISGGFNDSGYQGWIVDLRAICQIKFNPQEFVKATQLKQTCIANANGVTYPVTRVERVKLLPYLFITKYY